MLTRRTFLQGVSAALATFVVPGQRRNIDLMDFCGENARYDYSLPNCVNDFTYATDARLAVRVRPILADAFHHQNENAPPFHSLPWDKKGLAWKSIPNLEPLVATDTPCPKCDGSGYWPEPPESALIPCDACWGEGCRECDDRGDFADGYECAMCRGKGLGVFPGIIAIDGAFFRASLFAKFQRLGGECVVDREAWKNSVGTINCDVARFRFSDGTGMLLLIESKYAIERIELARNRT